MPLEHTINKFLLNLLKKFIQHGSNQALDSTLSHRHKPCLYLCLMAAVEQVSVLLC